MAVNQRGDIRWFSPDPRAVIPLDTRFHVPHGLQRTLRKGRFEITVNHDFGAVIEACSTAHGATWISREIQRSYGELHRLGFAHSVSGSTKTRGRPLRRHARRSVLASMLIGRRRIKVALVAPVERLRSVVSPAGHNGPRHLCSSELKSRAQNTCCLLKQALQLIAAFDGAHRTGLLQAGRPPYGAPSPGASQFLCRAVAPNARPC